MDGRSVETADEEAILTFDVSDDALERAGGAGAPSITIAYCTHHYYNCDLPQ
jgi:hypothetical protein